MTRAVGVPESELLRTAARLLADAGVSLDDSLGVADDIWTTAGSPGTRQCFGPATGVADVYAAMATAFPGLVLPAVGRLRQGAEALRVAADEFARAEAEAAARLAETMPR